MPTFEFDLSNADPKALEEYIKIDNKIVKWSAEHPNQLTPKQREKFSEMLAERAKIMSKILGSNVYPVK